MGLMCLFGACHKFDNDLTVKAPIPDSLTIDATAATTVGESLTDKRAEFAAKMQELRALLSRQDVPVRQDTLTLEVASPGPWNDKH